MMATTARGSGASILTRSWLISPAWNNYRAGKSSRQDSAVAYKNFPEITLRRSPTAFKIRPRQYHSTSRLGSKTSSAIPHITYHIAASSSGKGRRLKQDNIYNFDPQTHDALGIQQGDSRIIQRRNRPDSGQDAFFVAKVGPEHSATAFGIADGVGGWANQGVDPADFSHGLCSYMAKAAVKWSNGRPNPRALMEIGYQNIIDDPAVHAGGSTACVGVADHDGRLQIANLGDSGFLQLRLGAVHHYSTPQTHAFNTPYQLSITPPEILAQTRLFGGAPLSDLPDKAELADHALHHGDVLILASDGVWDNLTAQEILQIVSRQMRRHGAWTRTNEHGFTVADDLTSIAKAVSTGSTKPTETLQGVIAFAIATEAKLQSMNARRDGPFAREVQKHFPEDSFHGGKVDDISVIVLIPAETGRHQPVKAKL